MIDLNQLSRLPIGVQSFEDLRKENALYVDKTDYVYYLAYSKTKSYFLTRPRRFGKSLFANTLRAFFEGKKELFDGLKIYDYEKNWIKYPMAYFDFVDGNYAAGVDVLVFKILFVLKVYEIEHNIQYDESFVNKLKNDDKELSEGEKLAFRFLYDMMTVYEKTGLKTVIIVDEYDNPLITAGNYYGQRKFFGCLRNYT